MRSRLVAMAVIVLVVAVAFVFQAQTAPGPAAVAVTITVDAGQGKGELKPIWRWCGYDEPNYTYLPYGKKLVGQFTGDKNSPFGPAYFRAHNLLVTGDGVGRPKWGSTNIYTEDAAGKPVYDWTIIDKIFDTYIEAGARPYAQIGFMPKALSLRPEPYEHNWTPARGGNLFTGWTTPPNNYDKWRELNFQWAKHCVEKYGMEEVKKWYWEVWNEPNIAYFTAAERGGNKEVDYCKVWDYAADGIREGDSGGDLGGGGDGGGRGTVSAGFYRALPERDELCDGAEGFAAGDDFVSCEGEHGEFAAVPAARVCADGDRSASLGDKWGIQHCAGADGDGGASRRDRGIGSGQLCGVPVV